MSEDEFGRIDARLPVLVDGNAVAVVLDGNRLVCDGDVNVLDGVAVGETSLDAAVLSHLVVSGVDEELVKDLEETGAETDGLSLHLVLVLVVNPSGLDAGVDGADVRVGQL